MGGTAPPHFSIWLAANPDYGQWLTVGFVNGQKQLSCPTILHPELTFPLEHPEQREVIFPLAGRTSMAVLRSTAPRLVHNNIFFFTLNLFFLATNRAFIKKEAKAPVWPVLLAILNRLASYFSGRSAPVRTQLLKVGCGKGQTQPPFTTGSQDAKIRWPEFCSQPLLAQPEVALALAGIMSMTVLNSMALKLPNNSSFFFIRLLFSAQ